MGLFNRKKRDFIDLTERYKKQQAQLANMQEDASESSSHVADFTSMASSDEESSSSSQETSGGMFGFMNLAASNESSSSSTESSGDDVIDVSSGAEEKRRRLAKRLMDMTEKIEDLNTQIYHLQQRIEVLEKKSGSNVY